MSIGSFNQRNYLKNVGGYWDNPRSGGSVLGEYAFSESEPGFGLDFGSPSRASFGSVLDAQDSSILPEVDTSLNLNGFIPGSDSASGVTTPGFVDKLMGYKDPKTGMMYDGYAKTGLNALQAGLGFYLGKEQLDQAKRSLAENRRQFNLNYAAQRAAINDQLRWQHRARAAGDPTYRGQLTQIA